MPGTDLDVTPRLIVWETTRACDLACAPCRTTLQSKRSHFELSTDQALRLIDEVARMTPERFVLTGGDPLKRDDLCQTIRHACELGLEPSLAASATPLLTREAIERLRDAGLRRLLLRIDGASAASHDRYRGVDGSFERTTAALQAARESGLQVEVESVITRRTAPELRMIAALLAGQKHVTRWTVHFVVADGRAANEDALDAGEVESLFATLYELARALPFRVETNDAAHYRRYVLQRLLSDEAPAASRHIDASTGLIDAPSSFVAAMSDTVEVESGGAHLLRGLNEAKGSLFVSHTGDVYPSDQLPLRGGNIKHESLAAIYQSSELFTALRDSSQLKGKCGACEFREICGGSRSRAWSHSGDPLASDPACSYAPPAYGAEG